MSETKQPYIGAPVTLVSSLDVRYEGVLFTIDPNESTVALQNVRCLGTEGRQSGEKSIPSSDTVYEFIIFRGENIKSISLLDKHEPKLDTPIPDPSILKVGPTESKTSRRPVSFDYNRQYQREDYNQKRLPYQHNRGRDNYRRNDRYDRPQRYDNYQNYGRDNYRPRRDNYRNNYYRPRRRRKNDSNFEPGDGKFLASNDANITSMSTEFNFAEANERFDKTKALEDHRPENETTEVVAENAEENVEKAENDESGQEEKAEKAETAEEVSEDGPQYTYNPQESFFDDLDAKESRPRRDAKARRAVDAKTFGEEAQSYSPKVYSRRRRGPNRRNNRRYRR